MINHITLNETFSNSSKKVSYVSPFLLRKTNMDMTYKIGKMIMKDTDKKYTLDEVNEVFYLLEGLEANFYELLSNTLKIQRFNIKLSDFNHDKFKMTCYSFIKLMNKYKNKHTFSQVSIGKIRPYVIMEVIKDPPNPNTFYLLISYTIEFDNNNVNLILLKYKTLEEARNKVKEELKITYKGIIMSVSPEKSSSKEMSLIKPLWKLRDWINKKKLNWNMLSQNPNAINMLEENFEKINWSYLSANPNAIRILEQNPDKINWNWLSRNPNAIEMLEKNPDKINWYYLSSNPNAIEMLEKNKSNIDWSELSKNQNAIEMLEKNKSKINWYYLSSNPNAIELLKKNKSKINWSLLSANPNAIEMLEKNRFEIDWDYLSKNPSAIELLKKNQEKINWFEFSSNPSIFELKNI